MTFYQAKCSGCGALIWCSERKGEMRHDQQQMVLECVDLGLVVETDEYQTRPETTRCVCSNEEAALMRLKIR